MVVPVKENKNDRYCSIAAPTSSFYSLPSAGWLAGWSRRRRSGPLLPMSGEYNSYSFWGYFLILLLKEKLLLEIIKMGEFMDSISIVCWAEDDDEPVESSRVVVECMKFQLNLYSIISNLLTGCKICICPNPSGVDSLPIDPIIYTLSLESCLVVFFFSFVGLKTNP